MEPASRCSLRSSVGLTRITLSFFMVLLPGDDAAFFLRASRCPNTGQRVHSVWMDEINPGVVAGTDLRILEYPHPLLRAENEEIIEFDDDLKQLAKEMFAIMYASNGVGLAAPQLGINKRLMVYNPEGDPKKWLSEIVLCNPNIEHFSAATTLEEEGCLSFPGFTADVVRSANIKVVFQSLTGKQKRKKLRGWEARIFQHEYDHLDGTLYVDRLKKGERAKVEEPLDGLIAAYNANPGGGPPAL
mmetsp:Transcript_2754/g.7658  ORF Transcript_2754/g.7658 Transcript_2754/m.7658 type:complete len:244 (-) Transcript_2754:93-824(-)